MIGNALVVVVSFLVGWVALWPARRALGAWHYHLAALPVGIVGWTMAAGVAGLLGRGMSWPIVTASAAVYAGVVFWALVAWVGVGKDDGPPLAAWTYLGAGAFVIVGTAVATLLKITIINYDSWAHYQLAAIYLSDHGLPDPAGARRDRTSHSRRDRGCAAFGADWMYALYPLMAANVLLFAVVSTYELAAPRVGRATASGSASRRGPSLG